MMAELVRQFAAKNASEANKAANVDDQGDVKMSANDEEHFGPGADDAGDKEGSTSPETGVSSAPAGIN